MLFSSYDHQARRNERVMRQCQARWDNAQPDDTTARDDAIDNIIGNLFDDGSVCDLFADEIGDWLSEIYHNSGSNLADTIAEIKVTMEMRLMAEAERQLEELRRDDY